MMIKLLLLILFSITAFIGCKNGNTPSENQEVDFRNTRWGMTRAEVKKVENAKFLTDDKFLIYNTLLNNINTLIYYYFNENGLLYFAVYSLQPKHSNDNFHINDFNNLESLLIDKYGDPISNDIIWDYDLFKDDPQYWGFAVSKGYLSYRSFWETDRSRIMHFLIGENNEIKHVIMYSSPELFEEQSKIDTKKLLNEF